jgi:hypothetical protein
MFATRCTDTTRHVALQGLLFGGKLVLNTYTVSKFSVAEKSKTQTPISNSTIRLYTTFRELALTPSSGNWLSLHSETFITICIFDIGGNGSDRTSDVSNNAAHFKN